MAYARPQRLRFVFVLVSLAITATAWSNPHHDTSESLARLRKVPTKVTLSSAVLELHAEVWRDFMPGMVDEPGRAPDGGRPMLVTFNLIWRTKARPKTSLHAQKVWLVHDTSVWETTDIDQTSHALDDGSIDVRGGPNWAPRSLIDVIVRFADDQGKTFDIAVRKQPISASV
jgi:hypothetical protein